MHRAEARGETAEGMFAVDVRLLDSSWGRLMALSLENPLDDFDRVAVERAALAVAIDLLAQQHDEQLRARSRGAFLSELADGRVEEADARRRAEALGFPGAGRGALLPVVAAWRAPTYARGRRAASPREPAVADGITWTRLSGDLRSALTSTGLAVLLGPRDVDLLMLFALGARGYDAALAEHVATLFHGALDRHGLGPADAALAIGAPADTWAAAGQGLRRVRRSAGAATVAAGRPLARRPPPRRRRPPARPARHAGAATRSSTSSSGRCSPTRPRARGCCWRRSRRTSRRAAARPRPRGRCTSSASRCTCGCTGSRRRSASRWTTRTSCSGLHLAVRARRFRRRGGIASIRRSPRASAGSPGCGCRRAGARRAGRASSAASPSTLQPSAQSPSAATSRGSGIAS